SRLLLMPRFAYHQRICEKASCFLLPAGLLGFMTLFFGCGRDLAFDRSVVWEVLFGTLLNPIRGIWFRPYCFRCRSRSHDTGGCPWHPGARFCSLQNRKQQTPLSCSPTPPPHLPAPPPPASTPPPPFHNRRQNTHHDQTE